MRKSRPSTARSFNGNRFLFTDVLRDTMGFEGFVVSDANAVRNLATHLGASALFSLAWMALRALLEVWLNRSTEAVTFAAAFNRFPNVTRQDEHGAKHGGVKTS